MKINLIKNYYQNKQHLAANFNHSISMRGILKRKVKDEETYYKDFISKSGKTTTQECMDIINNHPYTINQCHITCDKERELYTDPTTLAKIAIGLKEYYDKLYDRNYTLVSIGTSPALIAEVMQNIGARVIFLPISDLRNMGDINHHPMRNIYPTYASRFENIDALMKYATKKGIAKKDAGKILILDYTNTGTSLDIMKKIIEERGDIPKENIVKRSLENDAKKVGEMGIVNITPASIRALQTDLANSNLSSLCNIPHFNYLEGFSNFRHYSNNEIMKKIDEYSTISGRSWALWVTCEAMRLLKLRQE